MHGLVTVARMAGAVAGLCLGLAGAPALAAEPGPLAPAAAVLDHVSVGYLAHDVAGLWSGFRVERAATAVNLDLVFAPHLGLPLGLGAIRPALGGTVAVGDGTSIAYADARYEVEGPIGTFFGLGLGLAVHDGPLREPQPLPSTGHDSKALGSRFLFHVPIEIGIALPDGLRFSAYFEHVSNGWIGTRVNEGMDSVGGRLGYKF
jgi:hypothetical protein